MGRIKSAMVKKAAHELVEVPDNKFTADFENNKKVLGSNTMPSKKIRNKIAGYIARLIKAEKQVTQ